MASISGKMGTALRESGLTALNMGKGLIYLPVGIHLLAHISKENHMDMVLTNGKMEAFTLVNSSKALNMAVVNGKKCKIP